MAQAGIALGSNLGDRAAWIDAALDALREISTPGQPFRVARYYESEPQACPSGSPPFLNTVAEISYLGGAMALLETLLDIESRLGRVRPGIRNAPRVIDLDLLYLGDISHRCTRLVLPHPRIAERRFVLQPLTDICPDLILPGQTETVLGLLRRLGDEGSAPRPYA